MGTLLNRRRYMGGGSALPYDAEIEYIGKNLRTAQDRGAYIDTGIVAKGSIRMEIDYSETTRERHNIWIYGARVSLSGYRYGLDFFGTLGNSDGNDKYNNRMRRDYDKANTSITLNSSDTSASRFAIVSNKGVLTINGTQYSSVSAASYNTGYNIYILVLNNGGSILYDDVYSDAELYIHSLKIYDDDDLVFNGIPVRKNGVGYLYDKVSLNLFGNSGTGSLIIGPDKSKWPYDELLSSLTIASGQTPAIITDYYPNQNTKVICSCNLTVRPSTSANRCLCGTFTLTGGTLYRRFDCQFKNNLNMEVNCGDGTTNKTSVSYAVNTQYNWEFGNGYIIKDNTQTSGTSSGTFTSDYPLVLFSNCNNGTPSIVSTPAGGFVGTINGSLDIYEGTTLMRSYHPAKKNGRVGLYESVANQMLFSPYGEFSE